MKKVIKSETLKDLDKVLGTKGVKKAGPPMTDALYDKLKDNSVA